MSALLKKVFTLIMTAVMLMASMALTVNAAEPTISLSSVQGAAGDEIAVNVSLLNNPGITALSIQIGYSADDLELIDITDAGLFADGISTSMLTKNPLTISWYASDSDNKSDSGTLAVLRFRIKNGAHNSNITVSYDRNNIFNKYFCNMFFKTENGYVAVSQKRLKGDADGDGDVSAMDATVIQRKAAGIPLPSYIEWNDAACDVNGDDETDMLDVTLILRWLAGMNVKYPIGEALS